jgi:hypothetical protein
VLFVGDDWAEEHHDVEVQGQAEQVVIGIETDRGPWEQALLAAGYRVWAINPLQVARYRERHSVSGAKAAPLPRTPSPTWCVPTGTSYGRSPGQRGS